MHHVKMWLRQKELFPAVQSVAAGDVFCEWCTVAELHVLPINQGH